VMKTLVWSESDLFETPSFAKLITRTRFCLLLKFVHFSDNNSPPTVKVDDKLYIGKSEYSNVQHLVMHLMDGLLNHGHLLYMDNFYNSPELTMQL